MIRSTAQGRASTDMRAVRVAAKDYLARGFAPVRLWPIKDGVCACREGSQCPKPGKHPIHKGWSQIRYTEEDIDQWRACNVGIITGQASGLVVLDIDGPQGRESLEALERQEAVDTCLVARSGRADGGTHLYYSLPKGVDAPTTRAGSAQVGSGLDFIGEGTLVVAPPSMHASGAPYVWESQGEPAPLPQIVLTLATQAKERARKDRIAQASAMMAGGVKMTISLATPPKESQYEAAARAREAYARKTLEERGNGLRGTGSGGRNAALYDCSLLAGRLVAGGALSRGQCEDFLWACAQGCDLGRAEFDSTFASGFRAGQSSPFLWDGVGQRAGQRVSKSTATLPPGDPRPSAEEGCGEKGQTEGRKRKKRKPKGSALPPGYEPDMKGETIAQTIMEERQKKRARQRKEGGGQEPPWVDSFDAWRDDGRPTVDLDGDLEDQSNVVEPLIDDLNLWRPCLYQRGRSPVWVVQGRDGAQIETAGGAEMRRILQRHFCFRRWLSSGPKVSDLPDKLCTHILADPERAWPPLERILPHAAFDAQGHLQDRQGYHRPLRAYLDLGGLDLPSVPQAPSDADAIEAIQTLAQWLVDFPFADKASFIHALALGLQLYCRDMIDGPTPLYLVTAPLHGSGKSKLVKLLGMVAAGCEPQAVAVPEQEDEMRKRITSTLLDPPPIFMIDNLPTSQRLDSGALAGVLTTGRWTDRVLGGSENVTIEVRCAWALTANNPKLTGELTRRGVWIHLAPNMEDPSRRQGFVHENIEAWTMQNRAMLQHAFLVLIQYWIAKGAMPGRGGRLGSYESWSAVLGGIFEAAQEAYEEGAEKPWMQCKGLVGHFLGNIDAMRAYLDGESGGLRAFVAAWWAEHGRQLVKTGTLVDLANDQGLLGRELGSGNTKSQTTRLGMLLSGKLQGRVFTMPTATVKVEQSSVAGSATYKLTPQEPAKPA